MKRRHQPTLLDISVAIPDWSYEREAQATGCMRVAGVDEAGRGPLAGPVVAAAVILPEPASMPTALAALRDSKVLTEAVRERLYGEIVTAAVGWAVAAVEPEEIDRVNILRATHLAMARALAALEPTAEHALVDGLPVSGLPCPHRAIVRGDAICFSIAAASILAKVTRDRQMRELDLQHPGYGLAKHKGYGTPAHLKALRELGPSSCHRHSFRPVSESQQFKKRS